MVREGKHETNVKVTHKKCHSTHTKEKEKTQKSTQENFFLRRSQILKVHSNHILNQDTGNYI